MSTGTFLVFLTLLSSAAVADAFILAKTASYDRVRSQDRWRACEKPADHVSTFSRRVALGLGLILANQKAVLAANPFETLTDQTGWGKASKAPKDWKISTNTGIAIQNYITADSAFVLVCPARDQTSTSTEVDASYLLGKVFDIKGRYGAFGKIDDIKIVRTKKVQEGNTMYSYVDFKFSSLSPGGRDIERVGCLKAAEIDGDAILLVASAKAVRWKSVSDIIAATVTSFAAIPAPQTGLKGGRVGLAEGGVRNAAEAYKLLRFDSPVWTS